MQVKVRLQATLKRSEVWVEFIVVLCVAVNAGKCPGNWIGIFFTLDFTLDFIFFPLLLKNISTGQLRLAVARSRDTHWF